MEIHRSVTARRWTALRKAQVIGASAGALLTLLMLALAFGESVDTSRSMTGDDAAIGGGGALVILVALPTALLCKTVGISSLPITKFGAPFWIGFVSVVTVVNSLLLFFVVTLIGCLTGSNGKKEMLNHG